MKNKVILAFLLFSFCIPANSLQAQSDKETFKEILGRWLRPDGGYVLVINNVRSDGSIDADYLNPNSINVSKAQASVKSEQINILIELKDKYYPGNYYELHYDNDADQLIGTYYHLGINQKFNVYFVREETRKGKR
jgi:hypothetical protein